MSKKVLSLVLAFAMILGSFSFVAAADFTDVPADHYAIEAIEALSAEGIIKGHGDGTFTPNNNVRRAEFAAMVNRAMEFETAGDVEFTDVDADDWFYKDVAIAVEAGFIQGHGGQGEGTFTPLSPITREQASTMIGRALNLEESEVATDFTDADEISEYAVGFVNAAAELGILEGYPEGDFKPGYNITRAQAALVIYRSLGLEQPADLTEYEAALDAVNEEDYTEESWEAYQEVVAENVVTEENTQAQVDRATAAILAAQEDLVTTFAAAEAAVEKAEASLLQADIDAAHELINKLAISAERAELRERLAELDELIEDIVEEVNNARSQAELIAALSAGPFPNFNPANIVEYDRVLGLEEVRNYTSVDQINDAINLVNVLEAEDYELEAILEEAGIENVNPEFVQEYYDRLGSVPVNTLNTVQNVINAVNAEARTNFVNAVSSIPALATIRQMNDKQLEEVEVKIEEARKQYEALSEDDKEHVLVSQYETMLQLREKTVAERRVELAEEEVEREEAIAAAEEALAKVEATLEAAVEAGSTTTNNTYKRVITMETALESALEEEQSTSNIVTWTETLNDALENLKNYTETLIIEKYISEVRFNAGLNRVGIDFTADGAEGLESLKVELYDDEDLLATNVAKDLLIQTMNAVGEADTVSTVFYASNQTPDGAIAAMWNLGNLSDGTADNAVVTAVIDGVEFVVEVE